MVISGQWKNRRITLSVKLNCLTISLEGRGQSDVFSFDYAGRLWTALVEGISYRRGLDGKVVARWQEPAGASRRWLVPREALELESLARETTTSLYAAIQAGEILLSASLNDSGSRGFERVIAFDEQRSQEDAHAYQQVYQPVGILPPDQYMAVVLQATEGCAFNTCTFCSFYKGRPFRIKTPQEFLAHAEAVKAYLGEGLSLRRTIFLGDANALAIPQPRLIPLLEAVHQVYDVDRLGGIYAFLDGFSAAKKTAADYRYLAHLGVRRVYVGLESGNASLLRFLKKPGSPGDALQAVRAMKAAGVAVGVIVLLGAGGQRYAHDHVKDTIEIINRMELDLDDLLYFSELILQEGVDYVRDAYEAHLGPLTPEERIAQGTTIEHGLKFPAHGGVPHISRYDIRDFVY